MLPEFDFWLPQTLPEALQQLAERGPDIGPVAGGTNVIPDLRSGRCCPKALVDLSRLEELRGIHREKDEMIVGGCVTLSELLRSALVREYAPPLWEAAAVFASPLVRNRATVGGNLVDASPAADTAPPLLALDAEVDLVSQAGCRTVSLDQFFTGVRKTVRRPDEVVAAVRWPAPSLHDHRAYGYYKLGLRKADAISVASLAVQVEIDTSGLCQKVRIALGSVAPTPLRAWSAEEALTGETLTPTSIAHAGKLAADAVSPISDLRASAAYRRRMVEVLVCRLLQQAADELKGAQ